jgi:hypothetical protein
LLTYSGYTALWADRTLHEKIALSQVASFFLAAPLGDKPSSPLVEMLVAGANFDATDKRDKVQSSIRTVYSFLDISAVIWGDL